MGKGRQKDAGTKKQREKVPGIEGQIEGGKQRRENGRGKERDDGSEVANEGRKELKVTEARMEGWRQELRAREVKTQRGAGRERR